MDGSNMSKNRPNDYLGVNKIGRQIRKTPLHQPNFAPTGGGTGGGGGGSGNSNSINTNRQQPQPQVYNISKSDFRSIVQQLTGSPSRQDPLPRPPNNPPKHPSMRLQRIRPPPLAPINRPHMPPVVAAPNPVMQHPQQGVHIGMGPPTVGYNNNGFGMQPPHFGQPSPRGMQPLGHGGSGWPNPALSPISAYMQQLQSCISDGGPNPTQPPMQPQMQPRAQGQQSGFPIQGHGSHPMQPQFPVQVQGQGHMPFYDLPPSSNPPLLPSPRMNRPPSLPSPRMNSSGLLPSPTSDFFLPSPSSFFNLSPTPRSPYPLLSPGSQFPPPLSPTFAFSPMGQSGFLAPGSQPPLSPGIAFPLSPSGFFPVSSPRWRD